MANYSKNDVVLVEIVYSDLTSSKIRPAVVVSGPHASVDVFVVPLSSRTDGLIPGEFVLSDRAIAGLHVASAVKRGIYTVHSDLVLRGLGKLSAGDAASLDQALRVWLDIK